MSDQDEPALGSDFELPDVEIDRDEDEMECPYCCGAWVKCPGCDGTGWYCT